MNQLTAIGVLMRTGCYIYTLVHGWWIVVVASAVTLLSALLLVVLQDRTHEVEAAFLLRPPTSPRVKKGTEMDLRYADWKGAD
jgi:hypothetical protein